jgi:predicted acyl esterase
MRKRGYVLFPLISLFIVLLTVSSSPIKKLEGKNKLEGTPPKYTFTIEDAWLTMKDGVRLSITFFKPVPLSDSEKFPVLFEFLPYRKDDSFYHDAVEIIDQLSKIQGANGSVGMWGISWGGFNAIQVAMKQPPALKAIIALCASDDLFHDDVHYIDGALHVDAYELSIDHDNGLPQSPDFQLDEAYFKNRFNSYPWFFTYLKQQREGHFWRKNSLRWSYDKISVPTYVIGGLLDGYRDSVPRMIENMKVPIKGVIGPWTHAWPDNGEPGPNYEWRYEAVRWWDHWLKGRDTGVLDDPTFTVFIRDGHGPDPDLKETPGDWICEKWPIPGTDWRKLFPGKNRRLQSELEKPSVETLRYAPGYGITTGFWWGEPTGDMRPDDAGSLVFDSQVLEKKFEIVGFPKVKLHVSANAPLAHWVARLEDVNPNGSVSLVTGALINGSQRRSRLDPELLEPNKIFDIEFEMHFTTWTFKPGHRIRLAISNALFPMIWPSPYAMTTKLFIGRKDTCLELPVLPDKKRIAPDFRPPEPREERPDADYLNLEVWPHGFYEQKRDMWRSIVSVDWKGNKDYVIRGRKFLSFERSYYEVDEKNPATSRFLGEAGHHIEFKDRTLDLKTTIDMRSDAEFFHVTFVREIFENDTLVRQREWKEKIPRNFN